MRPSVAPSRADSKKQDPGLAVWVWLGAEPSSLSQVTRTEGGKSVHVRSACVLGLSTLYNWEMGSCTRAVGQGTEGSGDPPKEDRSVDYSVASYI